MNKAMKIVGGLVVIQAAVLVLFWGSPIVAANLVLAPITLAVGVGTLVISTTDSFKFKQAAPGISLTTVALAFFVVGYVSVFTA